MSSARLLLLPTDGSPTAEAAARFAADIARAENRPVLVLAVAERAMAGGMEDEAITAALAEYMREIAETEASRMQATGVSAEPIVAVADAPHEAILEVAAEHNAAMIVMGTHGRSALARAVLGSVADRVVRHSPVPVVLVPLVAERR